MDPSPDPSWRRKGDKFTRLAFISGYVELMDQACKMLLLPIAAYIMNKMTGPHHEAIGFSLTLIQGFRFAQFFIEKRISIKDRRLNMMHDFAHYVSGGGIMAMIYGICSLSFHGYQQYSIFVVLGFLEAFSIIRFPEILISMRGHPALGCISLVLMFGLVIQIFVTLNHKMLLSDLLIMILMLLLSSLLATLLCFEELTKRINVFFHIGLCLASVIWNIYSWVKITGEYGVLLLFGTFFTGNIQIPSVMSVIALSSFPLLHKKDQNLTLLPYLLFIFNLSEAIFVLIFCFLEQASYTWFKFNLARDLNIHLNINGLKALDAYYDSVYKICSKEKRSLKHLSITNFAIECLDSKENDVKLHGLILLEAFVVEQKDEKVVSQIISSKALITLFSFLGIISQEHEYIVMKSIAAKIILLIDGCELQVVGAQQGIRVISSLLCVRRNLPNLVKNTRRTRSQYILLDFFHYIRNPDKDRGESNNDGDSTVVMGMKVFQNMLDNIEFLSESKNSKVLLNKLVSFMDTQIFMEIKNMMCLNMSEGGRVGRMDQLKSIKKLKLKSEMNELQKLRVHRINEISKDTNMKMVIVLDEEKKRITSSLNVILKLTSFKSLAGNEVRERLFQIPSLLRYLSDILHNDIMNDWKNIAINIVGNLALHEGLNNEMGVFIPLIMPFVDTGQAHIAERALCNLSMINKNCKIIWDFKDSNLFKHMLKKLHMEDKDLELYVVGNLLYNLFCGGKEVKDPELLLTLVLKRAKKALQTDDELETLETEAFIGLASQLLDITPFENITENFDELGPLLVECLQKNVRPRTSQLRRVILQMMISILKYFWKQHKVEMIDRMIEKGMPQALSEIQTTVIEKYRRHFGDIGVIQMDFPISQLVLEARQQFL